ncbi:MAG: gamma-glutamylcyclotransferase family protein, partial [Persicimonas sp.]
MKFLKYFAYGSNMLTERLRRRVPSTTPLGPARLEGFELRFHKRGADGSAKCNVVADTDACVHGVLFEIHSQERYLLDRAEGLGYGYELVDIELDTSQGAVEAFCYVASPDHIDRSLLPFRWYKDFVVHGGVEHQLPAPYVQRIRQIEALSDT